MLRSLLALFLLPAFLQAQPGKLVEWEGWSFRWSMRKVEGLVLTDVRYQNRLVLKYAGLAEIFVPYDEGSPRPVDLTDGGFGKRREVLQPGIDCASGNWCKAFDADGNVPKKAKPAVVMLHEENTGVNYLGIHGRVPGKMLVLWSAAWFPGGEDGYTYILRWKFRDDGTIVPEIGATGVPQHLQEGDGTPFAPLVGTKKDGSKVRAPGHVHNYLFRLDFDVDGPSNTVEEFNWVKETDARAKPTWTPIKTESGRSCNLETFRSWRVVNHASKNALGLSRSYQLVPGNTGIFRGQKSERGLDHDLWVTRSHPKEIPYSASDKRTSMDALPTYNNGEATENADVVVWYWLAFHHQPRSEDYVYQPMAWRSFELMPRDFLDGSPLKPSK